MHASRKFGSTAISQEKFEEDDYSEAPENANDEEPLILELWRWGRVQSKRRVNNTIMIILYCIQSQACLLCVRCDGWGLRVVGHRDERREAGWTSDLFLSTKFSILFASSFSITSGITSPLYPSYSPLIYWSDSWSAEYEPSQSILGRCTWRKYSHPFRRWEDT